MKQNKIIDSKPKKDIESFKNRKKIFVFSFYPRKDEITQTFLSKKVGNLLRKHDQEIIYIFISRFSLISTLKVLNNSLKPRTGYIISDNGACLYDISNKKVLFKNSLQQDVKSSLIHEAILKSFLIISASKTKCSLYFDIIMKYKKFINDFDIVNTQINNFLTFWHYIYENEFLSFAFYESNSASLMKKYKIIKTLESDLKVKFSTVENNMFCVSNDNITVEKTYFQILELLKYKINNEKTYYFALNSFYEVFWNMLSKNHFINISHLTSNHNSIKTQIVPQDMFLPESIDKIINKAINSTTFKNKHSITAIEKEFVSFRNKNH